MNTSLVRLQPGTSMLVYNCHTFLILHSKTQNISFMVELLNNNYQSLQTFNSFFFSLFFIYKLVCFQGQGSSLSETLQEMNFISGSMLSVTTGISYLVYLCYSSPWKSLYISSNIGTLIPNVLRAVCFQILVIIKAIGACICQHRNLYSLSIGRSDLATRGNMSLVFSLQLGIALDTAHHSSP